MAEAAGGDAAEARDFWDAIAEEWQVQVGREGDANRRLASDPVLWRFAGDVRRRRVLDAGCGTGYLTAKLHERGARVVGVDFAERMVEVARRDHPHLDFRLDDCASLSTLPDESQDLVVANYVLMDTPDLEGTMRAFHRVLVPHGVAVVVFSHPCFPAGRASRTASGDVSYRWEFPYFEPRPVKDPPWAHFTRDFLWFHRPLSAYWRAFTAAGFAVMEFDEPRPEGSAASSPEDASFVRKGAGRPYSVAFKLRKEVGWPTG